MLENQQFDRDDIFNNKKIQEHNRTVPLCETAWEQRNMTAEEKAAAKEELEELNRIKDLLANTIKAAEKSATEIANNAQKKSSNNLENQAKEEYNGSTNYSLKDDGKSEQYGVMWTLEKGVLDNSEVSAFYDKVAETKLGKYSNYNRASDGQLIYEIGDKLVYTDGDFDYPKISKIVTFNTEDSYFLEYGKESFYDGEEYGYKTDTIIEIVESVLGEGSVKTTAYSSYETNKRRGRSSYKRTDSTEVNRRSQKDVKSDFSLKNEYWHTGLTKAQIEAVEKWVRNEGKPEATRITDTANWYEGRLDGKDLFVIYSTEVENNPTVMYVSKGKDAKTEADVLKKILEVIENGKSAIGIQRNIDRLLGSNWLQEKHNLAHNDDRFGERGSDTGYASVLQGESSELIGSEAFRNVIENLIGIQERKDGINHSLKSGVSNYAKWSEDFVAAIDDLQNGTDKGTVLLSSF